VSLQEPQAAELREELLVEGDLGRFVESLDRHVGVELGVGDAIADGGAVAARDLVGEHEREQLVERHALCLGELDAFGERVDHATESKAA
jgi:hypothetical protein